MGRRTRRLVVLLAAVGLMLPATLAQAGHGPDYDRINAIDAFSCGGSTDTPTGEVRDRDEGAEVPPNHCMLVRSKGNTGLILVFEPDNRGPSEGISFDPKADRRPCPHDPGSPDGTWWSPMGPDGEPFPFFVCHHRPPR